MFEPRFRQIHLDFHTSEAIPGIGSEFDPEEYVATLQRAHVNSITSFARCHHGWLYHQSAKFPERIHPHLTRNLLAEQIEVCHAHDIRVPIYTTVRIDWYTAQRHVEWLCTDENGCIMGTKPFEAGFYRVLCLNTPYVDFLEAHTIEVCETLPTDGIFFDIVQSVPCCCRFCVEGMIREGRDPSNPQHRAAYGDQVLQRFQKRLFHAVHSRVPEAQVFFNQGHVGPRHRPILDTYTHLELESLPSGGWGYLHFPMTQRFARNLERGTLGMTGKFHTSWGDFQSFKNPRALEFECLNMLALGAKCGVGDQLHPTGKIDAATYDLIGGVYAQVEAAEPWCVGAVPQVDVGVFTPEEFVGAEPWKTPAVAMGAVRLLQEIHCQFDMIDSQSDFAKYKVLILPDEIPVNEALAEKISAYLAAGGSLIASYKSGLDPAGDAFVLAELGVAYKGPAPFSPDFIVPGKLGAGLLDTPYVMYTQGLEVAAAPDSEVLSPMIRPYFNRTWEHFCSHLHTPAQGPADYPGVMRQGRCVYFMHSIFGQYQKNAPLWCKRLLQNALDLLLPEPVLRTNAPSMTLLTVNAQPEEQREVVHVLHYIPERRGEAFDIIEEALPLHNVRISLRTERAPQAVTLEPQGQALEFEMQAGRVEFVVPEVTGHQMAVVSR
jgi:hypothetical protein